MSKTIDFVPAARRRGVARRLAIVLLGFSAICVAMAYNAFGVLYTDPRFTVNEAWLLLAFPPGVVGLFIGLASWVAGSGR
jgi:hypothetical protein